MVVPGAVPVPVGGRALPHAHLPPPRSPHQQIRVADTATALFALAHAVLHITQYPRTVYDVYV
eukprot:353468-Rhodomonas_salina.1